jgi:phosphoenolpyruvate carboxykinase (GTP)
MGDYFSHWLAMGGKSDASKLPRIYFVNWFRKDVRGKFVWPGYGENSRVLKWIVERLEGRADAQETAIGRLPTAGSLDLAGLELSQDALDLLLTVDADVWAEEADLMAEAYLKFGDRLPKALSDQQKALVERLKSTRQVATAAAE